MTDADFLRAIIAAPADDGPRLVYADWLEERGGNGHTFGHADAIRAATPLRKVRLTTSPPWPENVTLFAGGCRFNFPGRPTRTAPGQRGHGIYSMSDPLPALAAEWPGIEFELPTVNFTFVTRERWRQDVAAR